MITIPFEKIDTLAGVRTFIDFLFGDANIEYLPETNFETYHDREGNPWFTDSESRKLNDLNEQCWQICEKEGVDIYIITMAAEDEYRKRNDLSPLTFDL